MKHAMYMLLWFSFFGAFVLAQPDQTPVPSESEDILQLPGGISLYVTCSDGTQLLIDPNDGSAMLPVGKYKIRYWNLQKKDTEGNAWKLRGYGGSIKDFEIAGKESTNLDIKAEPIDVKLKVSCNGDYIFTQSLRGPNGESLYLYCNDKQISPPPIVITNQDKSFSVSLTGKYG